MNVPSYAFLGFVAVVAAIINCNAAPRYRRGVLLVANACFLATFVHSAVELLPVAALLALGFGAMHLAFAAKRTTLFVVALVVLVGVFVWLKQYGFVPRSLLLTFPYLTVGLSYVFFRMLSLVIDAFQGSLAAPLGAIDYIDYTLNFSSLVSGPIQLYADYHRTESVDPPPLDAAIAGRALERIVLGLFKVSVASPLLLALHDRSLEFALAAPRGPVAAGWMALAIASFPVYIYANFSGYMDVVVASARFMRLALPENFRHPFMAEGFLDFWGRWHITLSNWFKTYVFSTLLISAMRRFPSPASEPYLGVTAFFVTFFLVGLWHGQTSEFVAYGILQGLGVSVNKLYQILMLRRLGRSGYRTLKARPSYAMCSRGFTFTYFSFTLLWFWGTWPALATIATTLGAAALIGAMLLLFVGATLGLTLLKRLGDLLARDGASAPAFYPSYYARTAWSTALLVVTLSVTVILNAPAPHIVYKGF